MTSTWNETDIYSFLCYFTSLTKQPTFSDVTTGFSGKTVMSHHQYMEFLCWSFLWRHFEGKRNVATGDKAVKASFYHCWVQYQLNTGQLNKGFLALVLLQTKTRKLYFIEMVYSKKDDYKLLPLTKWDLICPSFWATLPEKKRNSNWLDESQIVWLCYGTSYIYRWIHREVIPGTN